jgi:hypothetical protein
VLLHDSQELDNDLGGRSDHDLTLASLLGVVDGIESIVEDRSADHLGGIVLWRERFSNRAIKRGNEVSIDFSRMKWNRKNPTGDPQVQSHIIPNG